MRNFSIISERLKETVDGTATSLEEVGDSIKESYLFRLFFGGSKRKKNRK